MKRSILICWLAAFAIALLLVIVLSATNVCSWWWLIAVPFVATTVAAIYAVILFKQTKPDKVCTGDGIAHMEIEADQPWEKDFEVV
jgi:hypothetical protein